MAQVRHPDRRQFLETLSAAPLAAVTPFVGGPSLHARILQSPGAETSTGYLFAPDLTYLSTATLGPCSRDVVEATVRAWYELESNPQAMGYGVGATLAAAEKVRQDGADLLGCDVGEIAITRSTTDGINAVAQGLLLKPGDRVLITDQEHEGGMSGWQFLASRLGVGLDVVPIPHDVHDAQAVLDLLSSGLTRETRVISVSHVLSSTGLRMPIPEIAAMARARGLYCIVDGAQSAGCIQVDVKALGCHAYATSGHKWLMGPKGTGLLYVASDVPIHPIQFQDGRTYYSHSSGVGNLPGAAGLGVAIAALRARGMADVERHNLSLRDRIYEGLQGLDAATVVSPPPGAAATPLVTFELPPEIDSRDLVARLLEVHRIQVKMVPKRWMNGIRLSPHVFNTEEEVDKLLSALHVELA